jgi:hypothetical protein
VNCSQYGRIFKVHTFLVDLACAQHDELHGDTDSKEGIDDAPLQDLTSLEKKITKI